MVQKGLFAVFLAAATLLQAADKIVGGPFVVNVGQSSATVVWVIESSQARLGTIPGVYTTTGPSLRVEKVGFTGLEPGKKYYYDVPDTDETEGYFKTAPVGRASFEFVVYGDTRTRHELHQEITDALEEAEPDFILHTGDLVSNGTDAAQWPVFFAIENEILRKTAFFPVLGNHERNSPHFYEFFDVETPFYSFNWGSAHFIVLNSDVGTAAASEQAREAFWAEQLLWLEDDLAASQNADFRFVTMHHPPFTAVMSRQEGDHPVDDMVPLFEKYRVNAVFNGHDHNYQHHVNNGVHYVVTGGGGAPLYPVDGPLEGITQKVESTEHYVTVKVEGAKAVVEAIALDGHLIDTIELQDPLREQEHRRALENPELIREETERILATLRDADWDDPASLRGLRYRANSPRNPWQRWVRENLPENPIERIELGEVNADDQGWPTVEYVLTLENGDRLEGVLSLEYQPHLESWIGASGLDWHLEGGE